MAPQQLMGLDEPGILLDEFTLDRLLDQTIGRRIVRLFLAVPEPHEHAQTVGLESQNRECPAKQQDLLGARITNGRETA